jgi:urease accessory protein
MDASRSLLAALQLADSALPIGRFVHSHGIESWLHHGSETSPERLAELVEATVCEAVAPLDGVIVAHAHRANELAALLTLDRRLTARKLTPAARSASEMCGRQLAALAPALAPADALVASFAETVRNHDTFGNLAVVHGTVARALEVPVAAAVLIELRGAAAAALSAGVRLGAVSPTRAQVILAGLAPALEAAAERALDLGLDELSSTAPELELCALAHRRADARMFST